VAVVVVVVGVGVDIADDGCGGTKKEHSSIGFESAARATVVVEH
jgi:hypothetical protein